MKRRDFFVLIGGAAASWPLAAGAQRAERLARIGYDEAFLAGLTDLGYVEGRNVHIEFRSTEGHEDRIPGLVTELIGLNVDVIVSYADGGYFAAHTTTTIPIVIEAANDLVAMGLAASLAHPGGNCRSDRRREQHRHSLRLTLVPSVDQPLGVFKHLSVGRAPCGGCLLGDLTALILQLAAIEAHSWMVAEPAREFNGNRAGAQFLTRNENSAHRHQHRQAAGAVAQMSQRPTRLRRGR
jgi:ABC transporter substrate binding protein